MRKKVLSIRIKSEGKKSAVKIGRFSEDKNGKNQFFHKTYNVESKARYNRLFNFLEKKEYPVKFIHPHYNDGFSITIYPPK